MNQRSTIFRFGAITFVVLALGYAGYRLFHNTNYGTTESEKIELVCAKCQAESAVSYAEFEKLALNPVKTAYTCPKCGAMEAQIASMRCGFCKRAIPPQPMGSALVCPFCKKSLEPQ